MSEEAQARKLVATFARLADRTLWLDNSDADPSTDGHVICVPFAHEQMYTMCEHELAHVYFETDAAAKKEFVTEYTLRVTQAATKEGIPLYGPNVDGFVSSVVSILDDYRVNRMWGEIYAGSGPRVDSYIRNKFVKFKDDPNRSIIVALGCHASNIASAPSKLDRYLPAIDEALAAVDKRPFPAVLLAAKRLLIQIIDEILAASPDASAGDENKRRLQALERLTSSTMRRTPKNLGIDDVRPSEDGAQHTNVDIDNLLNTSADEIPSKIESMPSMDHKIQKALNPTAVDVRESIGAKIVFYDLTLADIDPALRDTSILEDELNRVYQELLIETHTVKQARLVQRRLILEAFKNHRAQDADTVDHLRSLFVRILAKRRSVLAEVGATVSTSAYIERVTSGQDLPVFHNTVKGRGFHTLILLDRSASMFGTKTADTERACSVLAQALKFPFVDLEVWGFNGPEPDQVSIFRYAQGLTIFGQSRHPVKGGTPTHIALQVAVQHLRNDASQCHIVLLTDGQPSYVTQAGTQATSLTAPLSSDLHNEVRKTVRFARGKGIAVSSLLVGSEEPSGEIEYEVSDDEMTFMMGSRGFWQRVEPGQLSGALVKLVSSAFLRYAGQQ